MNTKDEEVFLIDVQITLLLLTIGSLIVSVAINYDAKMEILNKPRLFTDKQAKYIILLNRFLTLGIFISFLLVGLKNTEIAKEKNENIRPFLIQDTASVVSVIASIILVYGVLTDFDEPIPTLADFETAGI